MNRFPKFKNILMTIMIIAVYFIWPYFINSILKLFVLSDNSVLYIKFFSNFGLLGLLISLYYDDLSKAIRNYKNNFKEHTIMGAEITIIGIVIMILLKLGINNLFPNVIEIENNVDINNFKSIYVLFIFNILIYYPISEELVFKRTFKDIIDNKWFFVLFTGIISILFNIGFMIDNIYILSSIVFAITISYIYYKTDNIVVSILFKILATILFLIFGWLY